MPLLALCRHVSRCLWIVAATATPIEAPQAFARELSLHSFGQADGLTDLNITSLSQDPLGYIYAGTEHGIYVFDGIRFVNLGPNQGLPDGGEIRNFVITKPGRIIVQYDSATFASSNETGAHTPPESLRFAPVRVPPDMPDIASVKSLVAWGDGAIAIDRGALVTLEPGRSGQFNLEPEAELSSKGQDRLSGPPVSLFSSGKMLIAADGDGKICELRPIRRPCFGTDTGLPKERWIAFLSDGESRLLARSTTSLARLDLLHRTVTVERLPERVASQSATYENSVVLLRSPRGDLITQAGSNLLINERGRWTTLGPENGIPDAPIYNLAFDREKRLWMSVAGRGLFLVQGYNEWENYDRRDGLESDIVWQIARKHDGPIWFATDRGADTIQSLEPTSPIPHYPGQTVSIAIGSFDHVWRSLGSNSVACIMTTTGEQAIFPLPFANRILRGRGSLMRFLTNDGIFAIEDDLPKPSQPVRVNGTRGSYSDGAVAADGSLWAIGNGHLIRIDLDGSIHTIVSDWREPGFVPLVMALDGNDVVWVGGSGGGLRRLQVRGEQLVASTVVNPPEIASTSVESLLVDAVGRVWVGTDDGLSVFDGKRWLSVNQTSGLVWNDLTQGGLFQDGDGSLWIGTSNGVSHLLHPSSLFRLPAPRPVIDTIWFGSRSFEGRSIGFTRDPLTIRFGALGPSLVARFRYRLDGVDKEWAETGQGEARYAFVPPGHHRFELIAYDPLTHQQSAPVSVLIRMQRPMWQWWPFLVGYALAAFAAVYALWRMRYGFLVRQQRKLHREVERQTREIRAAQEALRLQASQDSLTGLLTRGEIQKRLDDRLAEDRHAHGLTIGLIDIDHFKRINDHFGHLAGDEVLREMGGRLRDALHEGEAAGRYGGEEILVVLPAGGSAGLARIRALKEAVCADSFLIEVELVRVTCSIGVASAIGQDDWKSLIGRADRALYQAKAEGRDRIVEAQETTFTFQGPATVR